MANWQQMDCSENIEKYSKLERQDAFGIFITFGNASVTIHHLQAYENNSNFLIIIIIIKVIKIQKFITARLKK